MLCMPNGGPFLLSCAPDKKLPGTLFKDKLMAHGTPLIVKDRCRTCSEVGGHALGGDEGPGLGVKNLVPDPYSFLLAGLGACTAITLRMYADRKDWPLESVEVGLKLVNKDGLRIDRVLDRKSTRLNSSH